MQGRTPRYDAITQIMKMRMIFLTIKWEISKLTPKCLTKAPGCIDTKIKQQEVGRPLPRTIPDEEETRPNWTEAGDSSRQRCDAPSGSCVEDRNSPPGHCTEGYKTTPLLRCKNRDAEGAGTENGIVPVSGKERRKDEGTRLRENKAEDKKVKSKDS
ncbi:hypothetical protein HAX54_021418 [Datura stramonium]|uniref:Uncharacterized protein n=1 Tax=Datura stramonium TaxID=4076 RepID=A0ABS8USV4_DATST|nr:hypothetical protein [Datura stramonium]